MKLYMKSKYFTTSKGQSGCYFNNPYGAEPQQTGEFNFRIIFKINSGIFLKSNLEIFLFHLVNLAHLSLWSKLICMVLILLSYFVFSRKFTIPFIFNIFWVMYIFSVCFCSPCLVIWKKTVSFLFFWSTAYLNVF